MKKIAYFVLLISIFCSHTACMRRPLSSVECPFAGGESAKIDVSVDWSLTGYDIDSEEDYIHRVSFRFFPKDGSAAFDRYLEDDVQSGTIEVPIGEYSVVIFNESIYDTYWQNSIIFENVDNYSLFSAKIVDQDPDLYSFYTPAQGEALSVEALNLASGSVDNFVVTKQMCTSAYDNWSDDDKMMVAQLNPVTPRRLTCETTIEVDVDNLSSAYYVNASLTGLAQRVFLASGDNDTASTTHVGALTQRLWYDDKEVNGVISESRLTFSTPSTSSTHTLTLDVILTNGERHTPDEEMVYDVTDQIHAPATRYADNDLGASVALSLPEVSDDIEVSDWEDNDEILIQ